MSVILSARAIKRQTLKSLTNLLQGERLLSRVMSATCEGPLAFTEAHAHASRSIQSVAEP